MSRPGRKRPCLPIRLLALGGGVLLLGLAVSGVPAAGPGSGPAGSEFFEKEVRPLLVLRCGSCHGATQPRGALNLVERGPALRGGGRGAAILPGRPERSLLIQAVRYAGELRMPPDGKLSGREQATLVRWVALGAPWPEARPAAAGKSGADRRRWWSFQPIRSGPPPPVRSAAWPRGELDRFLLAEMERRGLTPAPPADRRTWIRRATLDLTGLLPTPEEVTAFLLDRTETAHEQVVDRLLASPAYGQRWARHWLDVARYADYHDTNPSARVESCEITEAWRYRDWVVDSLNRDLPYDQFIHHQIAGDLLPPPAGQEFNADGLVATTFLSNGVWDRGDADKEKIVSDMVDDNIDTIGKAFLGLTLGCARCHDHKFDPTTQRDYYALAGIFYSTHILKELGAKGGEYTVNRIPLAPRAVAVRREQQQQRVGEAQKQIEALDKKSPRTAAEEQERARLIGERDQLQQEIRAVPLAMAVQEGGTAGGLFPKIQDVPIHIRGSYAQSGPVVPRGLPAFLAGDSQPPIRSGSGRRELAAWVASPRNPLTARVLVNRVWQWHFGSGLVRTPNNLGLLSEPPTHPALLDWLAARFMEEGWSLKKLHRRIMLSAAYRQGGSSADAQLQKDPENLWVSRFVPRRLEAEAIRDTMLQAAGRLDPTPGGPAFVELTRPRRSLYVQTCRWDRSNFATQFDAANPDASVERRAVSTVAPQALTLLNHEFARAQATALAERLLRESAGDDAARIERAYQLLFARRARPEEVALCRGLLIPRGPQKSEARWQDLAHVLLCSNEFAYLE